MGGRLIVVAGFGDVGARLGGLRRERGDDVLGLRRSDAVDAVDAGGIRRVRADLASGSGLKRLPRQADALVFCAAPDQRDEAAYRALYLDGLRRLMDACDAPRLLFTSSTSTYAQDQGEWVDEDSPAEAQAFNGRVLREAEQALSAHPGGIVLRLSGLYGPGREAMLRKAAAGEAAAPRWSNRLHVADAAAALSHLLDLPDPDGLYLGNDDLPATEHEVLAWLRTQQSLVPTDPPASPPRGRRIRNARLRATGWAPAFPDYRAGYAGLLPSR